MGGCPPTWPSQRPPANSPWSSTAILKLIRISTFKSFLCHPHFGGPHSSSAPTKANHFNCSFPPSKGGKRNRGKRNCFAGLRWAGLPEAPPKRIKKIDACIFETSPKHQRNTGPQGAVLTKKKGKSCPLWIILAFSTKHTSPCTVLWSGPMALISSFDPSWEAAPCLLVLGFAGPSSGTSRFCLSDDDLFLSKYGIFWAHFSCGVLNESQQGFFYIRLSRRPLLKALKGNFDPKSALLDKQ